MIATTQTKTTVTERGTTRMRGSSTVQEFPDIQTIRDAIPKHCFEPSTARSLSYVARDLTMASALIWGALKFIPQIENSYLRFGAWMVYGLVQGMVCTGIWILAHECGHGAFSKHGRLNDFVGWVLHSSLMVPYFSWKFSHHRHHRFTGNMEKDMVFVPAVATEAPPKRRLASFYLDPEILEDAPIVSLIQLIAHQLAGWQMYLMFNVSAGPDSKQRKNSGWLRVSHFEPTSAVFRPSEAFYIFLADVGLALTCAAIYYGSTLVGWPTMAYLYLVPYMWWNHWLVAITYLHHTHPDVPHYEADSWTYVKGSLATVDRDFGWIDKHLFHGIIGFHVIHHMFARIPFYYAEEATAAVQPVIGSHYHREPGSFLGQLWTTFTTCRFVEKDPEHPGAMRWVKPKNSKKAM